MENKKKKVIIGVAISALLVLVVIGTYAWWTLTHKQNDYNSIKSACLKFKVESEGEGLNLDGQWPSTLKEGYRKQGYTFTVENQCDEPLNYIIALEEIKDSNYPNLDSYVSGDYVDITIDNRTPKAFNLYDDIIDDDDGSIIDTKILKTAWVRPNETNTHTIKMWLDEKTNVSESGKIFNSKVRVTGGQKLPYNKNITSESCFTINEEGQITNFDYENCNTNVVFPPTVNGIHVKAINLLKETSENITSVDLTEAYYLEDIRLRYFAGTNTELIIPGYVNLNNTSFANFNGSNLIIEDGVTELPPGCFASYRGEGTTLHIPSSVTIINPGALSFFSGKEILFEEGLQDVYINQGYDEYVGTGTDLEFPSTTRRIRGFFGFNGNSIKFNEGLERIDGLKSFDIYDGASPLIIPSTVTFIGGFNTYSGTVIIKNTEGSVEFASSNTFRNATVVYDPNYKE